MASGCEGWLATTVAENVMNRRAVPLTFLINPTFRMQPQGSGGQQRRETPAHHTLTDKETRKPPYVNWPVLSKSICLSSPTKSMNDVGWRVLEILEESIRELWER